MTFLSSLSMACVLGSLSAWYCLLLCLLCVPSWQLWFLHCPFCGDMLLCWLYVCTMHNIYLTHSEVQSLYITLVLCVYPCYNGTCALTMMRMVILLLYTVGKLCYSSDAGMYEWPW